MVQTIRTPPKFLQKELNDKVKRFVQKHVGPFLD